VVHATIGLVLPVDLKFCISPSGHTVIMHFCPIICRFLLACVLVCMCPVSDKTDKLLLIYSNLYLYIYFLDTVWSPFTCVKNGLMFFFDNCSNYYDNVSTGWLKIKYLTGEYAISPQPVV